MDINHRLLELKQKYLIYIDGITALQNQIAEEEFKLFQCQEEMRQLNLIMNGSAN